MNALDLFPVSCRSRVRFDSVPDSRARVSFDDVNLLAFFLPQANSSTEIRLVFLRVY